MRLTRRAMLAATGLAALPRPLWAEGEAIPDVLNKGQRWDEASGLVFEKVGGIGYHTTLASGTPVRATRSNLDYAIRLLDASHGPAAVARASGVIARVVALQEMRADNANFGNWPWYAEEPLAAMRPPDPNWADFNGARLSELLIDHDAVLGEPLKMQMRAALARACASIVRRDAGPSYTNIAMMGARVTLAGGELLGDARLAAYGATRLARLLAYTRAQGSFNEYNSPTYTTVGLEELEAIIADVRDPRARADAEALRRIAWDLIARHWHPATGEWAGPHARAYADRLQDDIRAKLAARTRLPLGLAVVPPLGRKAIVCPADLRARFAALPAPVVEDRTRFIRAMPDANSLYGTTWFSDDACLGSANAESFWTQRRPVLGYWRLPGKPAVLRLRCLKDGRDFASMGVCVEQAGDRLVFAVHPLAGQGNWHISLDRRPDGRYPGKELRLRISLDGDGAALRRLDDHRFELIAGGWKALVVTGPARFAGRDATGRWETASDGVGLDWVMPLDGAIEPGALVQTLIIGAIAVLPVAIPSPRDAITVSPAAPGLARVRWGVMTLSAPDRAPPPLKRLS